MNEQDVWVGPARNFRKRPVVIQAVMIDLDKKHNMPDEFRAQLCQCQKLLNAAGIQTVPADARYHIHTLEGAYVANDGDVLVKGVKGEFYPVRRDIFLETYEVADVS